jgi:hypothetical protein
MPVLSFFKLKKGEKAEDKADEHKHYMNLRSAARSGIPFNFDFSTITGMRIVLAPEIDIPLPTQPTPHSLGAK